MTSLTKLDILHDMKTWTAKDIRNLREEHGLSQPAFGNLLGVSGNYIYLLEKGVKNPSMTLRLLLDCVQRQFKENEKGKESEKSHGKGKSKRHL